MYECWYDYVKPKYGEKQKCVIWLQTLYTQKQMIFTKILQKMLKLYFIFMSLISRPLSKIKKKKLI